MAGRDQYMNFFTMTLQTGANATTLTNENYNTGAGVSTMLAWRIHQVEYLTNGSWSGATDGSRITMTLSTRKDLAAMPGLNDKGTICQFKRVLTLYATANGTSAVQSQEPQVQHFLPPLLVASPNFSIYWSSSVDFAGQQSMYQDIRIGFTTEKLTESAYREVFETWNYAN